MRKLRVAIIGLGIGRQHALAYQSLPEQFEIAAVCAQSVESARSAAADFGAAHAVTRFEDALALNDVDVIDVCTPPYLHAAQAEAALRAGKHVICEKPLAATLAEIDALAHAEAQCGRRLMPIFQYRFGGGVQKARRLIDAGLTGPALAATVEVHWRRRANYYAVPWRGKRETELGGVLTSQAVHALDALLYLLGPVRRVYAHLATRSNPVEVEDCAAVSMELANGALATLSASLGSAAEITRHRIVFERLVAESNTRPYSNSGDPWSFAADDAAWQAEIDSAVAAVETAAPTTVVAPTDASGLKGYVPPAGFDTQLRKFHDALAGGGALPVTIADARRAVELLSAIYHSARTRAAVELPLAPEHPAYGS